MKKIKKIVAVALLTGFVMAIGMSWREPLHLFTYYTENSTHMVYMYTGMEWPVGF